MTVLKLYNSLSRQKEELQPIDENHIRLYACGPTVYDYAHIGNARMAVVFDTLVRVLREVYRNTQVTYVSNITDIDDKIMKAAKDSGRAILEITKKYEDIYNIDMAALGVKKPDIQPRATQHIPEMIAQIVQLIERGHAYEAEGHVLFNVPSFENYGGLSGRSGDDQIAGARVDVAPYKRDAADFVLWKPSAADQPGWDSPWGFGRPGWHIECSAMAEKHLGLPFDIHGGGADLKFPHHENEIAQGCCAQGHSNLDAFAKIWVHNGFVTVEGEKMSKSLGNFTTVHDLIEKGIKGEVIRFALLSGHYRQPLDWTEAGLHQAKSQLEKFYRVLYDLSDIEAAEMPVAEIILDSLADDLNTPQAYAGLNMLARRAHEMKTPETKGQFLSSLQIMGFGTDDPAYFLGYEQNDNTSWIDQLLVERDTAKKSKNFARADEIRNELQAKGIAIEDTPQGARWRKI